MASVSIQNQEAFFLSAHKDGVYNSRTTDEGGITNISANAPHVQIHERDITGLCVPTGSLVSAEDIRSSVSEVSVPVYLAYDDVKSALSAAAGMDFNARAGSEIAIAMDTPGTVRMAWLCHRKQNFNTFTNGFKINSTTTVNGFPDSLGNVIEYMVGAQTYNKPDAFYSALHSIPSIRYVSKDVKSVEVTKVKIPGDIRPVVFTSPTPDKASNGSTIYPPGKYIVLFGFATMRCRNFSTMSSNLFSPQGWSFWLKVLVKVIVYALEVAAISGTIARPPDSTPAAWTVTSNLDPNFVGNTDPDSVATGLASLRDLLAAHTFARNGLLTTARSKKRKLK